MISVEETLKIKIPSGVEDGNYMTLDGQGSEDLNGKAGDLYVFFEEENHEHFSRYGNDVLLQIVLGYSQAVFGDKIDIPTIDGTAKLKVPSGIQPGQILRVRGKGFPMMGSSRRGDQLVKIQIDVPSKMNRDEKKSIEELLKIQKNKEIKFQRFED
jgi:molecular chaperone DnaJ